MKKVGSIKYKISDLDDIAGFCLKRVSGAKVITFSGSLGAGKTTLVAAILKKFGVKEPVTSPTFAYMNLYRCSEGALSICHFDLYRIKSLRDFEQAGFDEYLYQDDSICFVEWPEVIEPILKDSAFSIDIDFDGIDGRILNYSFKD